MQITTEIRVVEHVEQVEAELQVDPIAELEVLVDRQIGVQQARTMAVAARLHVRHDGSDLVSDQSKGRFD